MAENKPKYKRAFGNCEGCPKQNCAVWFVGSRVLCRECRDKPKVRQEEREPIYHAYGGGTFGED